MQLKHIDKIRYRKRLMRLQIAVVVFLAVVALSISSVLIHFLSAPGEGNFWLNVLGVVIAAALAAMIVKAYRQHPYLEEVYYVWQLKQELNAIYRKHKSLEAALKNDIEAALQVQYFNIKAAQQVYELDNNTLTMDDLQQGLEQLLEQAERLNITLDVKCYQRDLLERIA